jgi:hypothetical protein
MRPKLAAAVAALVVGILFLVVAPARVDTIAIGDTFTCPPMLNIYHGKDLCGPNPPVHLTWGWLVGNHDKSDEGGGIVLRYQPRIYDVVADLVAAGIMVTLVYVLLIKRLRGRT